MKSIFERLLECLEVPHTRHYAAGLYATHPHRSDMLGLWQMCRIYGIRSRGVRLENKDLDALSVPSVLHTGRQLVLVTGLTDTGITYEQDGRSVFRKREDFSAQWSGNALIIESDEGAGEPQYAGHRKEEWYGRLRVLLPLVLLAVCAVYLFFLPMGTRGVLPLVFALTDLAGAGICVLLMQKQMFRNSRIGDRFCSLFHQKDCNDILDSDKAKVMGYSWSEVGLGYFVVHYVGSTSGLLPLQSLSAVGWCAMLYGIWSIWYQARVARQWCMMCVVVQVLLWLEGIVSLVFLAGGAYSFPAMMPLCGQMFLFLCAMVAVMSGVHLIGSLIAGRKEWRETTYKYRSFKSRPEVFGHLLKQGEPVDISDGASFIRFGNVDGYMKITVLTNPHCNPCARLHKEIDTLLHVYGDLVSVQYIFCSFHEGLKSSARFLIAAFQQKEETEVREIYTSWYSHGKYCPKEFFARWADIDTETDDVEAEMSRHDQWIQRYGFQSTPTILVDGFELPEEYTLEDLYSLIGEQTQEQS